MSKPTPFLFSRKPMGMVLAMASLASCATVVSETSTTSSEAAVVPTSEVNIGLDHFVFGTLSSSAWVSEQFDGNKSRQFAGDLLHFTVAQSADEGGLDVGLSDADYEPLPVAAAKSNLYVCSSYATELKGPGRWWAGPKISVNWQGEESAKQNGDDWYENYVVEIASSSPQELHALFTGDYFDAEELPSLSLAGSTYRNYKIRFHDWWQFWSVRQEYRATGILPVEPIVDTWIANGLPPERLFDGVKANIETYGPIEGQGALFFSSTEGLTQSDCREANLRGK